MCRILYVIFVLICIIFSNKANAQTLPTNFNLITDGSFELTNSTVLSDTDFIRHCWIKANNYGAPIGKIENLTTHNTHISRSRTGKSYLSPTSIFPSFKTPPFIWEDTIGFNIRPYAEVRLLEPLQKGVLYYFSMYVGFGKKMKGMSESAQYTVANIGAYFSEIKVSDYTTLSRVNFTPQLNFIGWDIPYEDSFMYIKLSGNYVATGNEQFVTIGNFDYFKNFKFVQLPDNGIFGGFTTYYPFVDDISLVRDTTQPMISLDKFSLGNDTTLCLGSSLRIGGEPYFFGYKWNTGDTSRLITITKPGTYWCSADFGCNTVTDTIVVSASVAPAPFNIKDTALCEAVLPISISAPYTAAAYLWSNGSTDFTTSFNSIGRQWLRISNTCGDKYFTDTFEINSLNVALSNINLGKDTNNCLYGFYLDTITLQVPANSATQIKWSNGSSNSSIKVWEPGAYWVQVSNVCYTVADTINITGCAAREVPKVDIPNAFTPNGDGKNDVFRLRYLPQQVVSFSLKIYNRYGQMISELKSRNDEWDGGNYELGVYYYLFVYKDISGKEYTQKGDISLIR